MKRRLSLIAFLTLLLAGVLAFAQAKPQPTPAAPPQQQQQPAQASPTPESPQQELVETSKGAEHGKEEGDEEAQFKYSPSVQWLGRHLGMNPEAAYWLFIGLNFAVVAGLIFWSVKKYAPSAFRDRTALIKRQLEEARAASEDANRRLSEIEARLARLNGEIAEMRSGAEKDSASEELRLKAAAEEDKKKIITTAEQEIQSAAKMARGELKKFAAELAVALAEKKIDVTPQTDQALVKNFTNHLGDGGKS